MQRDPLTQGEITLKGVDSTSEEKKKPTHFDLIINQLHITYIC